MQMSTIWRNDTGIRMSGVRSACVLPLFSARQTEFHPGGAPCRGCDHHYSIDIKLMSIGKYATYI